jgi:hypothetical protein
MVEVEMGDNEGVHRVLGKAKRSKPVPQRIPARLPVGSAVEQK